MSSAEVAQWRKPSKEKSAAANAHWTEAARNILNLCEIFANNLRIHTCTQQTFQPPDFLFILPPILYAVSFMIEFA